MARPAHSLAKDRDLSLKEHLYESAVMTGGLLGRTIQTAQVR